MKLLHIQQQYEQLIDTDITINGWVLSVRSQKDLSFIKLTDGSSTNGIQLVYEREISLPLGSSISAQGVLIRSPAKGQPYELKTNQITIIGTSPDDYPLCKGKLPLDYIRNYAHLRSRTSSFSSIFRIKSAISHATHSFFREKGFLHINPNIITVNECEGGAGVFQLTEHDISQHSSLPSLPGPFHTGQHDWSKDHFGKPAYLTVSSQLQLEALACSLGAVYTTNKSFRSEHSSTHKHLSEFEHLEIEHVFLSIEELMQIGEDYIKYIGSFLLRHNDEDISNLGKFVSKGLGERVQEIVNATFTRITYFDAISILQRGGKNAVYGEDLCSEYENYLTEHFKGPVFVWKWPSSIKSFYMKQNGDGTCQNFDLLMPYKVGELIGGSMREDNLETLLNMMSQKGVSPDPLGFYLDLRKYGTVPHGGFGLGLDRMCMLFTGMENIKDVVAFPVYFQHCDY
jgi:asparaginyl-tRNA synthetase